MNIWLVKTGEPIPTDEQNERLHRMGILANELSKDGNQVTWWTSTVNHSQKKQRADKDESIKINKNYSVELIKSSLYKKNVSLKRILNHYEVAKKFKRKANKMDKPDIIVCSFPTIELSRVVVEYGKSNNVPVILDVRDLWPDVLLNAFDEKMSFILKFFMIPLYRQAKFSLKNCDYLTAVSGGYLDWARKLSNREFKSTDQVFPLGYYKNNQSLEQDTVQESLVERFNIEENKVLFWFLGSFGKSYDLETVIQSARLLDEKGEQKVQFIISGDGDDNVKYRKMAKDLKNIIFTGWINKSEVIEMMKIADIGIMAYDKRAKQGLPNKVFEYMSAGLPILSSLQSETKELIEKYNIGFTYEAGDCNDLIKRINELVENTTLRALMRENANEAFDNYNAETVYKNMIEYIYSVKTKDV